MVYRRVRQALEQSCLTVTRIATDVGISRATLEACRVGTRRTPIAARVRIGTDLAAHADLVSRFAAELGAIGFA